VFKLGIKSQRQTGQHSVFHLAEVCVLNYLIDCVLKQFVFDLLHTFPDSDNICGSFLQERAKIEENLNIMNGIFRLSE
jgi:hypothetical protein